MGKSVIYGHYGDWNVSSIVYNVGLFLKDCVAKLIYFVTTALQSKVKLKRVF